MNMIESKLFYSVVEEGYGWHSFLNLISHMQTTSYKTHLSTTSLELIKVDLVMNYGILTWQ